NVGARLSQIVADADGALLEQQRRPGGRGPQTIGRRVVWSRGDRLLERGARLSAVEVVAVLQTAGAERFGCGEIRASAWGWVRIELFASRDAGGHHDRRRNRDDHAARAA